MSGGRAVAVRPVGALLGLEELAGFEGYRDPNQEFATMVQRRNTRKALRGSQKASRVVFCQDAIPWLEAHKGALESITTSIPDASEVGLSKKDYIPFFRNAARLCLLATKPTGYTIFLQTDRKQDGWIDKAYLIAGEAEALGHRTIWHKIALRTDVGKTDLFRPTYSHMLCFSQAGPIGKPIADVVHRGPISYGNAFGAYAVEFVLQYLRDRGIREVVDPFVGSGTTLAIANRLGMRAIGVDIDPAQCKKALAAV